MTSPMSCDSVRELAPEAALDVLDAAVRADVLAHVAGCTRCRRELRDLAAAADALLLAAPPAEPPAGFEGRVLDRIGVAAPVTRRRWALPALAAAAALVLGLGLGVGARTGGSSSTTRYPLAAALVSTSGRPIGQVLISDRPDRMVCVLDGAPAGATYTVSVEAADRVTEVGTFTADGPGWPWAVDLPVEGAAVRRVVLRDRDGTVRATARIPT